MAGMDQLMQQIQTMAQDMSSMMQQIHDSDTQVKGVVEAQVLAIRNEILVSMTKNEGEVGNIKAAVDQVNGDVSNIKTAVDQVHAGLTGSSNAIQAQAKEVQDLKTSIIQDVQTREARIHGAMMLVRSDLEGQITATMPMGTQDGGYQKDQTKRPITEYKTIEQLAKLGTDKTCFRDWKVRLKDALGQILKTKAYKEIMEWLKNRRQP